MTPLSAEHRQQRILAAVRAIPPGTVASYAEVARRAGLPRGARLVVAALRGSDGAGVPWHRVLRADGRIAFAFGSEAFAEQLRRLRAEGVEVSAGGRVRVAGAAASTLDRALWGRLQR